MPHSRKHRRESILDAADRLLARLGAPKTTVDDLAREAGISRRTVYVHFASRQEILRSSSERALERVLAELRSIAAAQDPPESRLRRLLLARILLRFDVPGHRRGPDERLAEAWVAWLERRERWFHSEARILADVLEEGRRAGAFEYPNALAAARTLVVATNSLLPPAVRTDEPGHREGIERDARRVIELLLHGLLRRPGAR